MFKGHHCGGELDQAAGKNTEQDAAPKRIARARLSQGLRGFTSKVRVELKIDRLEPHLQ